MKKNPKFTLLAAGLIFPLLASLATAGPVGTSFVYQGRLTDNGATPTGLYDFEIQLHDDSVAATLVGSPNTVTLNDIQVTNGLYTVTLDFGAFVTRDEDVFLQIGVRPGASVGAYTPLTPRRRMNIAPHSARTLNDAYRAGGSDLGRVITMGGGLPVVFDQGGATFQVNGATINTFNGAQEKARIWGPVYGEVLLYDASGDQNVTLSSNNAAGGMLSLRDGANASRAALSGPTTGGLLTLNDNTGDQNALLSGSTQGGLLALSNSSGSQLLSAAAAATGGTMTVREPSQAIRVFLNALNAGGLFALYNSSTTQSVVMDGGLGSLSAIGEISLENTIGGATPRIALAPVSDSGRVLAFDAAGTTMAAVGASTAGGYAELYQDDGDLGIWLDGDNLGAGQVSVYNTAEIATIRLVGDETDGGGLITLDNSSDIRTLYIDGDSGDDGRILIEDQSGADAINMHADGAASAGEITVYGNTGAQTIEIQGQDADGGTGGQINLYNSLGTRTIQIDGDVSNDGRVITQELQITGGSDLSEQFDIAGPSELIVPGSVVCIDVNNPGKLTISDSAYCRTVAGIISGANGIETGMLMGQLDSEADGAHPVALSGRVYCQVDASYGAIEPGDLLTSSDTPGHAMKVTDHSRANGAIIGKAMTGLADGTGMVLVLVSLQ